MHFSEKDVQVTELAVLNGQVVIFSDAEGELGLKVHPYRIKEPENAATNAPPAAESPKANPSLTSRP